MPVERVKGDGAAGECGHFTDNGREYVITDPHTPRPWHNYLFNSIYQANITQFGTGASFYQPGGEGLRANVTEDRDGSGGARYVYLRDNDTGRYWSLTGAPGPVRLDKWECRVGLGYQVNTSCLHAIEAEWRTFVSPDEDPVEIWTITIRNRSKRRRSISVIPYLEMYLTGGSTLMDFIAVLGGFFDPGTNAVFGINSCVKFPDHFKAFLASDAEVAGATVSRDEFLGPYRDYHAPIAVERGDVHNPEAGTEWLGASLRHQLTLEPGERRTINCAVGVVPSVTEGRRLAGEYLARGEPERRMAKLAERADAMCDRLTVRTPDRQFDRWTNIWLKHQLAFVARWGRVIGRGFRDILQDVFAHRLTEPGSARECIKEVFSKQFPSGKCIRAWRLPTAELDLQDYADSPSWMIMALSFYLKETGDFDLLDEHVVFLNPDDPYAAPTSSATVWDHVVLAQRYLLAETGRHGLSKIHYGDWCDTLNGVGAAGEGESVMLSMQVKWGCELLAELADVRGDAGVSEEMRAASARLSEAVETHAWDGDWYLRAFDDDGVPVGTSCPPDEDNGEGKIFLNPQAWALIAGIGAGERQARAVSAARRFLDKGYGMVLNDPPYTGLKPRIGQMTAMTPGFYENASVYIHGNCFWIYGLARAGFIDEAFRAFRAILPDTPNKPNTDTEPFVIPNYYIGPTVERRRERNLYLSGWRTGSAAWLLLTGIEWFLGVRAEYEGLRIDPGLPEGWDSVNVRRPFRGDIYDVTIVRHNGSGLKISVDGVSCEDTLIRPFGDGKEHWVRVELGR